MNRLFRYGERGLAAGAAVGLLLFAGVTAWWYLSFMDGGMLLFAAWMLCLAAGLAVMAWAVAWLLGKLTGYAVFTIGVLLVACLLLSRFDYQRVGWGIVVLEGVLGLVAGLAMASFRRLWRSSAIVVAVALNVAVVSWLVPHGDPCIFTEQPVASHVKRLEYDSGTGVDGSRYFTVASRLDKTVRDRIWGFDNTSLPVRGVLYYPDSIEGRLPVVAILHGSHYMLDTSHTGYSYLASCLASQGYVVALVDENFINRSWSGSYGYDDCVGRGWLLLKNMEYLRDAALIDGVEPDMDNVALIGHSRGGDGVAAASWLNGLDVSPVNPDEKFDFGFGLRAIVEFAPVAMLTVPSGHPYTYNNVDYLLLHGDMDGDVSFMYGLRRYNTACFTDTALRVKAAVYMDGANHGQFNTAWGRRDKQPPQGWLLDTGEIMSPDKQCESTVRYVTAFLDAAMKGDTASLAVFSGGDDAVQYSDTRCRYFADFESRLPGQEAEGFAVADTVGLRLRDNSGIPALNRVLLLEWDEGPGESRYTVRPDSITALDSADRLIFSICADRDLELGVGLDTDTGAAPAPVMVRVEAQPLQRLSRLPLLLPVQGDGRRETVMRTVAIPVSTFGVTDSVRLTGVTFVFDRGSGGKAVIDNVGIRKK